MVVTAGAEPCMSWLTCVATTNCSVSPASNYIKNIKYEGLHHLHCKFFMMLDWFYGKVLIGIQSFE